MSQLLQMRVCLNAMSELDKCGAPVNHGRRANQESSSARREQGPIFETTKRSFISVNGMAIELLQGGAADIIVPFDVFVNSTTIGRFDTSDTGLSRQLHDEMFNEHNSVLSIRQQELLICTTPKTYAALTEKTYRDGHIDNVEVEKNNAIVPQYHAGWQSASGKLRNKRAKFVIHAVGPMWSSFTNQKGLTTAQIDLGNTIDRTLQCADNRRVKSIAFPVISGVEGCCHPQQIRKKAEQDWARSILVKKIIEYAHKTNRNLERIGILASDDEEFSALDQLLRS